MNRNDTFECICLPDLYKGNTCETSKVNLLYMTNAHNNVVEHHNHYNAHMQEKTLCAL